MILRSVQKLETAEGISLNIELSGVPARLVAFLIDLWASAGLLLFLCVGLALGLSSFEKVLGQFFQQYDWQSISAEIIGVSISLMTLTFFLLYFFLQEWLWKGKTLGKSLMKIRVVRNNGQPVGFWEAFGRNVFRLIDVMVSGAGVIVMLFSPSQKRLGDYLSGSVVINDAPTQQHDWLRQSLNNAPAQALSQTTSSGISFEEKALLDAFKGRMRDLSQNSQIQLDFLLRQYFAQRLGLSKDEAMDLKFLYRLGQ
ncbi:MAG: RDD family protein [Vampirovibrionales bacterium]|nr:RDD family protein [Vampirovibrionales bacterium]